MPTTWYYSIRRTFGFLTAGSPKGPRDTAVKVGLLSQSRFEVAVDLPLLHKGPIITLGSLLALLTACLVAFSLNALAALLGRESASQKVGVVE